MAHTDTTLQSVKGVWKKTIFQKSEDCYFISSFDLIGGDCLPASVENKGEFVALGYFLPEVKAYAINMYGRWQDNPNPKYDGKQFKVDSFTEVFPPDREGMVKALSCGLYKGIGRKVGNSIYDRFGEDSFRILTEETERLREVKGIGAQTLKNLIECVKETAEYSKLVKLLSRYGISANKVRRIQFMFPDNACELVKQEPFRLCEIPGFGFKVVDDIAKKLGTPLDSPIRMKAAIMDVLRVNSSTKGNLYALRSELVKESLALLNNRPGDHVTAQMIEAQLNSMKFDAQVSFDKNTDDADIVYRREDYRMEATASVEMAQLLSHGVNKGLKFEPAVLDAEIAAAEKEFKMQFAPKQKEAICAALSNKICVITGGPGTGKTTILRAILSIYQKNIAKGIPGIGHLKPLLLSPTGKAARRMSESARQPAFTVHKGLGITPKDYDVPPEMTPETMLTDDVGIVFIDEASMADMALWYKLISEMPLHTQLVAIGDVDQLPPVGAGAVLHDMIESKVIPVVRLDVIYRQGQESLIVSNSHKIREGKRDLTFSNSEFAFFKFPEKDSDPDVDEKVQEKLIELYLRAAKKYGLKETLILCPRREKVTCSAYTINERIQTILHGKKPKDQKFTASKKLFYVGDRVIQTVNTEKARNGDMGTITAVRPDPDMQGSFIATITFDIADDDNNGVLEYSGEDFENLQLGYSITVHKSQGSEAKAVFVPILGSQNYMLKRNLLYTAVTRGKEFVALFGQGRALAMSIARQDATRRKTMFAHRLRSDITAKQGDGSVGEVRMPVA